ncbi:unnamed protein product [Phytophthora lilii]|uniref:Sister chromatid cohesion protein n=1 Tax=Phytophthora lilii TaxID=2077276 RepID=A0A9W6TD58_9STRA|nr:unnamed protein product [Phytophthora lilii]
MVRGCIVFAWDSWRLIVAGCVIAGAVHGVMSSPTNKLKRSADLQDEQEYGRPRKRRSLRQDANSMTDEAGELQDCLDELNAEPDVDMEKEDEEELPSLSTQAEITADSVEKYSELLERLVENANHRQQLEAFERDDLDVFLPQDVKMLLQALKTMEKKDWITKLEPGVLISLMSALDTQVRLGLSVDALRATAQNSKEQKVQSPKIDSRVLRRLLASLDVAICELILLYHIIRRLLLPCIDTSYATTASAPMVKDTIHGQSAERKTSGPVRVSLRANKHIREAVNRVITVVCEFIDQLATLVLSVKLADRWLLPLSSSMVELFALDHSSYATSLQQSSLAVLRSIFLQYKPHRESLLTDIVDVMIKLPRAKRTLRTVKLPNSSDSVQRISTLVVSMIQSCASSGKLGEIDTNHGPLQDSTEASPIPDAVTEEKCLQEVDTVQTVLDETRSSAQMFAQALLKACRKKTEERDNRVVLDNFVEDLLVMFVRPEWTGAEVILEVITSSLASILHANISKDVKNPDSQHSLAALNLVGKICASIKRYQKKARRKFADGDSDSAVVIEEHKSSILAAIAGKKTRSKIAISSAVIEDIALKNIVVTHLQRYGDDQGDSKKLLLLMFFSEPRSGADAAYLKQERKLWKSLWDVPTGGVNTILKAAVATNEIAFKSSLHLAVRRGFCGLFNSLLSHIMALLSKGMPSLRARVMKCLRGIVDVDPMLMAESGVQSAVQRCCSDEKPSVREAAVELIGTYVLLQPILFDRYLDVLSERVRDKGIKVRKSVCKIFKVVLTTMQADFRDGITEQELRRKSACMRCLVERIGDASEDQGVKNFIIDTFQDVWFGADLSFSRLSNAHGDFGHESNLPPGWTALAAPDDTKADNTSSGEATKFISEDGSIANSVDEAWSAYRMPTVTPASVAKSNNSKLDNSSEVVTTIVEVIHGMPNLSWFVELLKRLLENRSSTTKKYGARFTKNRLAEVAIAEDRSEKIISRLVDCLMELQEGTLLQGVSIEDGKSQFVACMTALSVFCEAKPQLLARHLETIRVYLKEDDVKTQSLSVSMINKILSVKRIPQTAAGMLENDLRLLILRSPPSVVGPSVECLSTLSRTRNKAPILLLQLLERFFLVMREYKKVKSLTGLAAEDNHSLQRALFAAGKIAGATDIDSHDELASEAKTLKIGVITEALSELYEHFIRMPGNDSCSAKAVLGMGFLFPIRPRLFLQAQQDGLLNLLLTSKPGKATLQCLVSMKELLIFEEQRVENGLAARAMNKAKSKKEQVQGDQEADASLIGNVMQAELGNVLRLSLQKVPQIRKEAIACIGALLTQGLVNPLQCIPNLVALETDRVMGVRDAAFSQLLAVYERFQSQFHTPLIKGIRDSYSFQLSVYGTATALGIDESKKEFCLYGRLYTNCLKPIKAHDFLSALVNQFTDQGSVLKQSQGKSATNSKTFSDDLKYLCYLAQILSTLPYELEDEPLYIIYLINRYVSLRLGYVPTVYMLQYLWLWSLTVVFLMHSPVLDDLRETFATTGVAPDLLEDDESDLSTVVIDEYRPLRSLAAAKLKLLQANGRIAFALALMLRLKFALKRNYQLDNEKCAIYKPSNAEAPVEAKERSPKKLLLPSVDDLCEAEDPVVLNWNLFMTAWYASRKDQKQLDIDLEESSKPRAPPKRRRRSRKAAAIKHQTLEDESDEEESFVEGFA